ncbi:MAG: glycosyltransferase 87 family protein [Nocardioidaceae bacterium]
MERWSDAAQPLPFSHMCYSDISYLYVGRGLAEGILPYQPVDSLPEGKQPVSPDEQHQFSIEYPVLTGAWMGAVAAVTHIIGKSPDLSGVSHSAAGSDERVQYDGALFWGVNAVGFFVVLLIALALLVYAQRRRPWDAVLVAASPALALSGMINWDLLVVGCVAGFVWAWSTRRPVWAGVFIGLGAATKLFPLFFLGPLLVLCVRERKMDAWLVTAAAALGSWLVVNLPVFYWSPDEYLWFWQFNSRRGPDFGSLWLIAADYGYRATPHTVNVTTGVVFGLACAAIGLLGLLAHRRPRLVQLLFLVVASFLLVNKVYSPQYVLWLLPLAALARPRWRDMLIWQACEIFYFFAVWMHIANFFVTAGDPDWLYAVAIVVRIVGELYLMAVVVRDILRPWHDPVRQDGLSDDPLGGVLDEGIDAELYDEGRDRRSPGHGDDGDHAETVPPDPDRDPIYSA